MTMKRFHRCLQACLFLQCLTMSATEGAKPFEGHQLLSIEVNHEDDLTFLDQLEQDIPQLDFWDFPIVHQNASVLVRPEDLPEVRQRLSDRRLRVNVLHDDIYRLIELGSKRTPYHVIKKRMAISGYVIDHHNYHDYTQIRTFMTSLATAYPGQVTVSNMSELTYENRSIVLVKIRGLNATSDSNRPIIVIDAGVHAREWIAPATALYLMEQLLLEYRGENVYARNLLDTYDVYFIPVLNPDGYTFTHSDPENRLWRKNRQPMDMPDCIGADINRNFDVMFGTSTRQNWCTANSYPGSMAFSELESRGFKSMFERIRERVQVYLTFHSKGQYLLRPWAYSNDKEQPANAAELDRIGSNMLTALRERHGIDYTFGTPYTLLKYSATGTTMDWVLSKKSDIISFAFELRPKRFDPIGWMLPPDKIIPVGEEVFDSLLELVHSVSPPVQYRITPGAGKGSRSGGKGSASSLHYSSVMLTLSVLMGYAVYRKNLFINR